MGAIYDLEAPLSPQSPRQSTMLRRGLNEARRKVMLLASLACLIVMTLAAFRRQDQIREMLDDQRHGWINGTTYMALSTTRDAATNPAAARSPSKDLDSKSKAHVKQKHMAKGPVLGSGQRSLSTTNLMDLRNRTLGFENIFVLNVPSRTDKLDAMRLTASLTDFDFDVIKGVVGKEVSAKALSGEFPQIEGQDGIIGCWRGHMNFAHTIIQKKLTSALILEDDADWDVSFRSQIELFALGSQTLLETPQNIEPTSPYGDGWDLLWLGHCAVQPTDNDHRRFLMKNDPTLAPPNHRVNFGSVPSMSAYDNSTRIMFYSKGSTCTYAYALSYRGAQKVLKYMSMDVFNKPIDFGLHDMCSMKERGFTCISVFPNLVDVHKAAGGASKDSDIEYANAKSSKSDVREKGHSFNIVRSTRLNAYLLIDGKLNQAESQWPDETPILKGDVVTEMRNDPVKNTPD